MENFKKMREGYRLYYAMLRRRGRLFLALGVLFFLSGCVLVAMGIAHGKIILGILCVLSFIFSFIFFLLLLFCFEAYNAPF